MENSKINDIFNLIFEQTQITRRAIFGKTRKREVVEARMMAACLLYEFVYNKNLSATGRFMKKTHDTIIYYKTQVRDLRELNIKYKAIYKRVSEKLNNESNIFFNYSEVREISLRFFNSMSGNNLQKKEFDEFYKKNIK